MVRFPPLPSSLAAVFLVLAGTAVAAEPVDLELVLAVDVSSSVNYDEYRLQMGGYAAAFRDDGLIDAIHRAAPRGVAVALVQWSGTGAQRVVAGWARVFQGGRTDIGDALRFASGLFADNGYLSPRQVIDVSGDGRSNQGDPPTASRDAALARGLTVNGLAVRSDVPTLDGYYRANVIGGPTAFTLSVERFEDFAAAILGKLITEIAGIPIAAVGDPAYIADSTPARKAARLAPSDGLR